MQIAIKDTSFKMHSVEELGSNVPAFLAKLWKIVEDPQTNDLICWSPNGRSFFIRNQARFARELLPLYYKHNNMASFVRQLNMYGFHKVVSIEGGGLKIDKDEMEFAHQYFILGHPYLMEHIKRKMPTSKIEEGGPGSKPELMNKVLADVKSMKGRQDSLDSQLSAMKRENEVLWREVAILRQKHLKQQQIVNKLIQFLVSMVQSSRNGGIGIKRHYPLMLNDTSHCPSKVPKVNLSTAASSMSPTGPVIHELDTADLLEECEPTCTENSLPSDFCDAILNAEKEGQSPSSVKSNQATLDSPNPTNSNPSPEVLLELAEECPLSPSMLLISPENVGPEIVTPKAKSRSRGTEKKRKSKKLPSVNKTDSSPSSTVLQDPLALETEETDNGVDLLDVMLPAFVSVKDANLLDAESDKMPVNQSNEETTEEALAAAADAAISAISDVAAANKDMSSESMCVSSGKSVPKTTVKKLLPAKKNFDVKSGAFGDKNKWLSSGDIMIFKQEPSTSDDQDKSNMVLACTGNNSDESFNRFGIPEELDNHVDSMQTELDSLRDILKGEGYSLDANTLLGLFSEDPLSDLPNSGFEVLPNEQEKENITGNELATYSSNLLDMVDMFEGPEAENWSTQNSPDSSNIMDVSLSELNTPSPSSANKLKFK